MKLNLGLKNIQMAKCTLKLVQRFIKDERISKDVRQEYMDEFNEILNKSMNE